MEKFWIADLTGVHALIEGTEQRDLWVGLRGWRLADQPSPADQTRIVNGPMFGCVPFAAIEGGWADLGWKPGPPPEPADLTRDPAPTPAPAPTKPKPPAGGAKIKE